MPWILKNKNTLIAAEVARPSFLDRNLQITGVINSQSSRYYGINEWKHYCVHLFKEPLNEPFVDRLYKIVNADISPVARLHFAWPIDIVLDEDEEIIGYVVSACPNLHSLKYILQTYSDIQYEDKLCIARNICIALNIFHHHDFVFGNLNLDNIYVDTKTWRVFLDPFLDAQMVNDIGRARYHFNSDYSMLDYELLDSNNRPFYSSSFNTQYLAPEIYEHIINMRRFDEDPIQRNEQHSHLDENYDTKIYFSKNTDLFSLSVILFILLNKNKHPLSCIIEGKQAIDVLYSDNSTFQNHQVRNLMTGTKPKTSLIKRTFGIFNYKRFFVRLGASGKFYDKCFNFTDSFINNRPSISDWVALINKKARGVNIWLPRIYNNFKTKIKSLFNNGLEPITDERFRNIIVEQYPKDIIGSETVATPRVYWRTTCLFMIAFVFSFTSACILLKFSFINILGLVIGACIGFLFSGLIASKMRNVYGFRPRHYVLNIILTIIFSLVCGLLLGGGF